jgi:beta-lactamase family protein
MISPPRITIRYGLVSLLKHSRVIYATPTLRIYVALVTVALCAAPTAAAGTWRAHIGEAREYAAKRAGHASFGVRTQRGIRGTEIRRPVPSASVVKAMLLVAYLRRPEVRHRRLRRDERALLGPMIRRSDNAAASQVCNIVGTGGLTRLARRAHMHRFHATRPWGLSTIDVADQTRFFLHIDRRVPRRHRRYALRLLGSIVPAQRWGIARVRPPGWALYFKGGWGSGTGWVDHQVALLRRGRRRLSVAILITSSPSHAYGNETLRGVAARLLRGLRPRSRPR